MATQREVSPEFWNEQQQEACPLTDMDWLKEGAPYPPEGQAVRLERYAMNRQLWKGNHTRVYGDWWKVLRPEQEASLEMVLNWHKRLSTLWADLLLSEPPKFMDGEDPKREGKEIDEEGGSAASSGSTSEDSAKKPSAAAKTEDPAANARQEAIDRIVGKENHGYVGQLYKAAIDISRYGDGLVKVSLKKGEAHIKAQPPHYWFPVVDPNDLQEFTHHVLMWKFRRGDEDYLRVEIHERGKITHKLFSLKGNMIGPELNVQSVLPHNDDGTEKIVGGVEDTKVDHFLVVPFRGLVVSDEIFGDDDYQTVDNIIRGIELRAGQIARVLDKHTDPSMYGPPDQLQKDPSTGETVFKSGGNYFEVDGSQDDVPPGYVTWDGQLEAQFQEIETLLHQLYILSETSPAAFGQLESGLAESGSALRRLMQAPLAKVARIALNFDPAAKHVVKLAAELERAHGIETPEITSVNIQWQDGLPKDPKEQAEVEQIRTGNKPTTSTVAAISRIDGASQEEAEAEFDRIQEEAQAQTDRDLEVAKAEIDMMPKDPTTGKPSGKPAAVKTGKDK